MLYSKLNLIKRFALSFWTIILFSILPLCYAQNDESNDLPTIQGIFVDNDKPFHFDFLIDRGVRSSKDDALKRESAQLIKYFLTALTIPDEEAWVNLSPIEKDRIIPESLGKTEMGRQMLAQDYELKQLAARLTHPDTNLGKAYWQKVKEQGLNSLDLDHTLSKVWIIPDRATVIQKNGFAYISEHRLKVMMNEESQADLAQCSAADRLFQDLILPVINREVNDSKTFAVTRQIYQAVILAAWYKQTFRNSLLSKIYIDRHKVAGDIALEPDFKSKLYEQYLAAFQRGAYNLIQEDRDESGELIPRKYFSGGNVMRVTRILRVEDRPIASTLAELSVNGRLVWVASSGNLIPAGETQNKWEDLLIPLPFNHVIREDLGIDMPRYLRAGGHDFMVLVNQAGQIEMQMGYLVWMNGQIRFLQISKFRQTIEPGQPLVVGRYQSGDDTITGDKMTIPNDVDPQLSRRHFRLSVARMNEYSGRFEMTIEGLTSDNQTYLYNNTELEHDHLFRSETGIFQTARLIPPTSIMLELASIQFNTQTLREVVQAYLTQSTIPQGVNVAHQIEIQLDPKTHRLDQKDQLKGKGINLKLVINPNRTLAIDPQSLNELTYLPRNLIEAMEAYNQSTIHPASDFGVKPGESKEIYFINDRPAVVWIAHIKDAVLAPYTLQFKKMQDGSVAYQIWIVKGDIAERGTIPPGTSLNLSLNPYSRAHEEGYIFNPKDDVKVTLMNIQNGPLIFNNTSHAAIDVELMQTVSTPVSQEVSSVGGIRFDRRALNLIIKQEFSEEFISTIENHLELIPLQGIMPMIISITPLRAGMWPERILN